MYDDGGDSACPPDRPCAERDDNVLPVQMVIPHFFGGDNAVGVKPP